ncbi:MAG: glycosyltransferase family 4 protein [Hyphomicrobium sp.]|jgi:glycosyltransferase involved in cell wall biosynthesis
MKRLRVLFVCHGHPDLVPGGTEMLAHDLCRAVRHGGYADTFFLGCVTRLHRAFRPESRLQTINADASDMLLWVGGYDPFAMAQTDLDGFVRAMREVLAAARPDIVHFHHLSLIGLEALTVVRRLLPEARIVVTLHDYTNLCFNDGLLIKTKSGSLCRGPSLDGCHDCFPDIPHSRFLVRSLHVKTMLGFADQLIAPSRFLRERFLEWGIPAERIRLIANAVPAKAGARSAESHRHCWREPPDPRSFGFFGNIAPHKGILVALAAVQQVADAGLSLDVHGGLHFQGEPFRGQFLAALAASQAAAHWHGPYARDHVARLMSAVAWVIVPSTWWENAPLVILEAFRHRRPVICSDIGGMAEMVEDGVNGLLFRAGDAVDLARTMRRAASERGLLETLQSGLPDVPELNQSAAWHAELYAEVLAKDSVNPPPSTLVQHQKKQQAAS